MEINSAFAVPLGVAGLTGIGWLIAKVYNSIGHRIANVDQTASAAARLAAQCDDRRRDDVTVLFKALGDHRDRDEAVHRDVMTSMNEQTRTLGMIHAGLEKALGDRPTRDEVTRIVELSQGRARS